MIGYRDNPDHIGSVGNPEITSTFYVKTLHRIYDFTSFLYKHDTNIHCMKNVKKNNTICENTPYNIIMWNTGMYI